MIIDYWSKFIIIGSSRNAVMLLFLGWSGTGTTFLCTKSLHRHHHQHIQEWWASSSTQGQGLKSIWLTKGLLPEVFLCLWFWLIISNWLPDRSNHFNVVKTKRIKSIIPIFGRNHRNYLYIIGSQKCSLNHSNLKSDEEKQLQYYCNTNVLLVS